MAHVRKDPPFITDLEVGELVKCFEDQVVPGIASPTQFVIPSISGTIDAFTEEITYHESETYYNASGVVGRVSEEDVLLGWDGVIEAGDTMVMYAHDAVSGILPFEIDQLKILSPAVVSGLYNIEARMFDVIGDTPIFIKYALKQDKNG